MQLTRFDRWLREMFVYETHIQTLRPVEEVPRGVRQIDLPETPGRRFKHLYIAPNSKDADRLIASLKENSQMYQTSIVDKDAWYVPLVAPKEKSVTWWLFSVLFFTVASFVVLLYLKTLVQDPEFRKNFAEAIEILKG
jgi:hypothetical protein